MAGKAEFQEYIRGRLHRMNQGQAHLNTPKVAHTGPLCLFQGYLIKAERSHERSAEAVEKVAPRKISHGGKV